MPLTEMEEVDLAATLLIAPPSASSVGGGSFNADTLKEAVSLSEPPRLSSEMSGSNAGMGTYEIGDVVENYRIESVLGAGGMGQVFRAVHELTGQEVALKMLHQEKNDTARERARFLNEARVLAQLDHPNLVPLLGFIEEPTGIFIVLPFVSGETLEDLLARDGRPGISMAINIFDQLCAGLAWVHEEKKILHRDLKPANVMITEGGVVKLTDFGIARQVGDKPMTAVGMVVGTAEYLAPERAAGTVRDDPRSDLYGLAVMLYELLTGHPPFRDANAAKVMLKHLNNLPPSPRGINPAIPIPLERELLKALAKEPEARHASITAFREAIHQAVASAAMGGKPTTPAPLAGSGTSSPLPKTDTGSASAPSESGVSVLGYLILGVLLLALGAGGYAAYYFLIQGGQ